MRTRIQSPPPDPLVGKVILSFRIERKLAEGGMGAVYLARHEELAHTLKVIKVLLPAYAEEPVLRQRFRREAEAASRLKHDKILGVDNFGTLEDGQLFMMVPFLEGEPLDAFLHERGGRLAPHRALHLAVQICDALDYAHARGIIHRDLKPGNVFVVSVNDNPYVPKLLDFGIAKLIGARELGPRTQSGVGIGTPGYMAVEQYARADEVTPAADIYSLAVVIWELVTGRRPWEHTDRAQLYLQQRTVPPARPPSEVMPADWANVLLQALSVDPGMRPSARELAVALASTLPAIGRVPSGAEILAALAPHFVRKAAPDAETIRNVSDVDRIGPLLWPPRETEAWAAPPTGQAAATRSAAAGVSRLTTKRRMRWRLVLAVVGTAGLAAVATGAFASRATEATQSTPATPHALPVVTSAAPATPRTAREATPPAPALPHAPATEVARVSPAPASVSVHQRGRAQMKATDLRSESKRAKTVTGASRPRKPMLANPDDVVGPEL